MIKNPKIIKLKKIEDNRGYFIKIFHSKIFKKYEIKEQFITQSKKNVFRGFHFQNGKYDVDKLVFCVEGEVLDIVININKNSNFFGKEKKFKLTGVDNKILYIPKKHAHGFLCLSRKCTLLYMYNKNYNKKFDKGILFNDEKLIKKYPKLIISNRDKSFPSFKDYFSIIK